MATLTQADIEKAKQRGYSQGYAAGKRSKGKFNTDKQSTYNCIVQTLSKMYLDGGWGTTVEGKHKKWTPDECFQKAIKYANQMIREVDIR